MSFPWRRGGAEEYTDNLRIYDRSSGPTKAAFAEKAALPRYFGRPLQGSDRQRTLVNDVHFGIRYAPCRVMR